jgi:hypothetical protein
MIVKLTVMDKFKLTASEFAKMLGISTSAVRHQRLKGKLEGQYVQKDSKYFYAPPSKSRPNIDKITAHNNPKFTGSIYKPKKYKSQYFKKKNRNVPYDETKYHNAPNGSQLQLTNDLRTKLRIDSKLKASDLEYITDDLVLEIKRKKAKELADKVKSSRDQSSLSPAALYLTPHNRYQRSTNNYSLPMKGRWYNHDSGQMEDHDPPKKKYGYYDI